MRHSNCRGVKALIKSGIFADFDWSVTLQQSWKSSLHRNWPAYPLIKFQDSTDGKSIFCFIVVIWPGVKEMDMHYWSSMWCLWSECLYTWGDPWEDLQKVKGKAWSFPGQSFRVECKCKSISLVIWQTQKYLVSGRLISPLCLGRVKCTMLIIRAVSFLKKYQIIFCTDWRKERDSCMGIVCKTLIHFGNVLSGTYSTLKWQPPKPRKRLLH